MKIDDKAKAKILILHIVSDVPGITYHLLMDKCLDSLTMDFFSFSEFLNELISSNLLEITSETDGTGLSTADSSEKLIYITSGGSAVLEDIKSTISSTTKAFLNEAKEELTKAVALRNSIKSNIEIIDGRIFATLTINDESGISFKTQVRCDSQEAATELCTKWRKNAINAKETFLNMINN